MLASHSENRGLVYGSLDLDGSLRIRGSAVDLGCFEFSSICPGDLNGYQVVNTGDLTIILSDYTCSENCTYGITGDGATNTADLQVILSNFEAECGDF